MTFSVVIFSSSSEAGYSKQNIKMIFYTLLISCHLMSTKICRISLNLYWHEQHENQSKYQILARSGFVDHVSLACLCLLADSATQL